MRFHKTTNVPYQMVYSSETENEYIDMYSMLPEINKLAEENEKLKKELLKYKEKDKVSKFIKK